jgi:hypothetical protein
MDEVMGTAEAARRLGMSPQRVRALWHEGALSGRMMANRLLLDRVGVLDLAERDRPATRPLSARNAWTLLLMLADEPSPWASASERSRLRRLVYTREERDLAALVRARARTIRLDGVVGAGGYVLRDGHVVPAGATLAHRWTDLVVEGVTEVYATEFVARSLTDRLRLWLDPQGPIVVHAVPDDLGDLLRSRAEMPAPVVATDLLDSGDPRSQRAGEALWVKSVQRWRDEAATPHAGRRGRAR